MQLMGEHSSTVVSAHWAIVDWSVAYRSGTGMHELISTKKKKRRSTGREWFNEPSSEILACDEKTTHAIGKRAATTAGQMAEMLRKEGWRLMLGVLDIVRLAVLCCLRIGQLSFWNMVIHIWGIVVHTTLDKIVHSSSVLLEFAILCCLRSSHLSFWNMLIYIWGIAVHAV